MICIVKEQHVHIVEILIMLEKYVEQDVPNSFLNMRRLLVNKIKLYT